VFTSWGSAVWGTIASWDWQTNGPIVIALAAGLTALATIVYTLGTLLLWGTTRRSVRAMENVVKLTFLQMLYETKRPSVGPSYFIKDPGETLRIAAERAYKNQVDTALQQVFPRLYRLFSVEEQATAPEERQDRP
jgi:hypothetical protein